MLSIIRTLLRSATTREEALCETLKHIVTSRYEASP